MKALTVLSIVYSLIASVKVCVMKLAKMLPARLTKIESNKVTKEIINSALKLDQSDLIKRLMVPFFGLPYARLLGPIAIINCLLSVFEKDKLLDIFRLS